MTQTNKSFPVTIKANDGGSSRAFKATITTDSMDRDREVVLPVGMDKRDFMKNPILLWSHDPLHPVGKINALYRKDNGWDMEAELADRPDGHQGEWKADELHALMKAGILKGISIGFMPIDSRQPSKKDLETYGQDLRRVITKYKLCEVSLVSVPANQDALVTACMKNADLIGIIKKTFNVDVVINPPLDATLTPRSGLELPPVEPKPKPKPVNVEPPKPEPVVKRIVVHHIIYESEVVIEEVVAKAVARANGKLYY